MTKNLVDKRTFEAECYKGLASRRKGVVEFLTIGCSMDSGIDLKKSFETFCDHLSRRKSVEWIAVHVREPRAFQVLPSIDSDDGEKWQGKEHMHILWAKPYIRMDMLRDLWQEHSGTSGGVKNRTVHGSLSARSQMSRLVGYLTNQDDHHDTDNREVFYYESSGWVLQSAGFEQKTLEDSGQKTSVKRGRGRPCKSVPA